MVNALQVRFLAASLGTCTSYTWRLRLLK